MAVDPISAGLQAATLISGKGAQRKAEGQANSAMKLERAMAERAAKLFDLILGKVQEGEGQGLFDADKRFSEMRKTLDRENDMSSERLAGDLRIAGGKPGERAVTNRLAGLRANQDENLARIKDEITQESFFNKLKAYSAANPSGVLGAAQIYGNQANRAMAMMPQGISQFFQQIMPFAQPGRSRRPGSVGSGANSSSGGYGQGQVGHAA